MLKRANSDHRETDAMRFIAANTTIPVPRVHATRTTEGVVYEIVMDYVPGEPLNKAWPKLTHDQRIAISAQLRGYLAQLKQLEGDRIQSVGGGSIMVGPFASEREFNDFMVEKGNERVPEVFKRYARVVLRDDHKIDFAHADFSPRNILVDGSGRVTAVFDWERAGWYPEYWDQARVLTENPGVRDYWRYIEHIIPFQYVQELTALCYVYRISGDG